MFGDGQGMRIVLTLAAASGQGEASTAGYQEKGESHERSFAGSFPCLWNRGCPGRPTRMSIRTKYGEGARCGRLDTGAKQPLRPAAKRPPKEPPMIFGPSSSSDCFERKTAVAHAPIFTSNRQSVSHLAALRDE